MTSTTEQQRVNRLVPTACLVGPIVARPQTTKTSARGPARRNVWFGILVFIGFQVAAGVAIERDWWPIADPIYTEKAELIREQKAFFAAQSSSQRVLAMGSSRTQLAFDAHRFMAGLTSVETIAFNFGTPGGGPVTCRLYWQRLREEGVRAEAVFVEVHPALWCEFEEPFEARWLQPYRLRHGEPERLRALGWNFADPSHFGFQAKLSSTASYRMGLLNRHWPTMLPARHGLTIGAKNDDLGYVNGIAIPEKNRPRAFLHSKAEYGPCFPAPPPGGSALVAVRTLLGEIQQSGAEAILLVMPEALEMRSWYGPHHPAELAICLAALQREFGVSLIDGRDWVDDEHFVDGHHLCAKGAVQFTDRLIAAINARGTR